MKPICLALLPVLMTAPALAQEPTTLEHVTTRGIVMKLFGMEIPVSYTPDGKWTATPAGQKMEGVWRIDGDKLCTKTGADPEVCAAYPAGKKPGDVFSVPGAMGPQMGAVEVRIK